MLERYALLNNYHVNLEPFQAVEVKKPAPEILPDQTISVTAPRVGKVNHAFITVHKIQDYRKKVSTLLLLPDVHVEIENLLFDPKELVDCQFTL